MKSIFAIVLTVLICNQFILSQEPSWFTKIRKISPINSTETDVEALFGKPKERSLYFGKYETKEGLLKIRYSTGKCKANTSDYSVLKGTVIDINFLLRKEIELSKINSDLSKFNEEQSDDTENVSYENAELGISYGTYVKRDYKLEYSKRPKILTSIWIYPSTKYDYLECPN